MARTCVGQLDSTAVVCLFWLLSHPDTHSKSSAINNSQVTFCNSQDQNHKSSGSQWVC